jgi:hypothetical protein
MPSATNNLRPQPYGALRGVLRPVLRALVAFGWMWLPGVPAQEFFGSPWPYDNTDPVRTDEPAGAAASSRL